MGSVIKITVSGLDELNKLFDQEPQNQVNAMILGKIEELQTQVRAAL